MPPPITHNDGAEIPDEATPIVEAAASSITPEQAFTRTRIRNTSVPTHVKIALLLITIAFFILLAGTILLSSVFQGFFKDPDTLTNISVLLECFSVLGILSFGSATMLTVGKGNCDRQRPGSAA